MAIESTPREAGPVGAVKPPAPPPAPKCQGRTARGKCEVPLYLPESVGAGLCWECRKVRDAERAKPVSRSVTPHTRLWRVGYGHASKCAECGLTMVPCMCGEVQACVCTWDANPTCDAGTTIHTRGECTKPRQGGAK